jgi:cell wall-associated NlpC family hydrolase
MVYRKAVVLIPMLFWSVLIHGDDALREAIVETAKRYMGVPYAYGTASPHGFDCSGFVSYVYRTAVGISIPRSSKALWAAGEPVQMAAARPGDIIVFNTAGGSANHVAILLDKGSVIHAVSSGPRTGVIISSLRDRYFGQRIMGARSYIVPANSL